MLISKINIVIYFFSPFAGDDKINKQKRSTLEMFSYLLLVQRKGDQRREEKQDKGGEDCGEEVHLALIFRTYRMTLCQNFKCKAKFVSGAASSASVKCCQKGL